MLAGERAAKRRRGHRGVRWFGGCGRRFRILTERSQFRGSGFGLFGLGGVGGGGIGLGGLGLLREGTGVGGRNRLPHFLALQLFEGAVIGALAGIDHPLKALESGGGGGESVARGAGRSFGVFFQEGVAGALPELGIGAAQAAEAPFVANERVDEEALAGVGGAVMFVVFGGELGEIFGFFVEHDLGMGEDAVLHGVVAGCGLALSGWSGRFLR